MITLSSPLQLETKIKGLGGYQKGLFWVMEQRERKSCHGGGVFKQDLFAASSFIRGKSQIRPSVNHPGELDYANQSGSFPEVLRY